MFVPRLVITEDPNLYLKPLSTAVSAATDAETTGIASHIVPSSSCLCFIGNLIGVLES